MLKGHKAVRVTFGICGRCKLRVSNRSAFETKRYRPDRRKSYTYVRAGVCKVNGSRLLQSVSPGYI